jgi:hypothetical protein
MREIKVSKNNKNAEGGTEAARSKALTVAFPSQ